jgi:hypothetical protein
LSLFPFFIGASLFIPHEIVCFYPVETVTYLLVILHSTNQRCIILSFYPLYTWPYD